MKIVKNDLFDYGLYIYQGNDNFKFSLDSILLAEYVNGNNNKQIVDFCTGNAVVPLILSTKYDCEILGFEIQESIYNLALDSVKVNNLERKIKIVNANIKDVSKFAKNESVDIVTCNPPYFKYNNGSLVNVDKEKAIARHEIELNLEDIFSSSSYILKNRGELYLVHRCDRIQEIINVMNKYNFVLKEMVFIYSDKNKEAIMVMFKAVKNGKIGNVKVYSIYDIHTFKTYKSIFRRGDSK